MNFHNGYLNATFIPVATNDYLKQNMIQWSFNDLVTHMIDFPNCEPEKLTVANPLIVDTKQTA